MRLSQLAYVVAFAGGGAKDVTFRLVVTRQLSTGQHACPLHPGSCFWCLDHTLYYKLLLA